MFRIEPSLPVNAFKTFAVQSPLSTHWRKATCKEIDCEHYLKGWTTTVIKGSEDEALLRRCGRSFTCEYQGDNLIKFTFKPEQPCFRAHTHRLPVGRPELFVVRDGDWRGNPSGFKVARKSDEWIDEFANNQDRINTQIQRG